MTEQIKSLMDYQDEVSELKLAANKARAIVTAFSREYVEGNEEMNILAIKSNPEKYIYLFEAMFDYIVNVCERAERLDNSIIQPDQQDNK
jgi:hypothetical protein